MTALVKGLGILAVAAGLLATTPARAQPLEGKEFTLYGCMGEWKQRCEMRLARRYGSHSLTRFWEQNFATCSWYYQRADGLKELADRICQDEGAVVIGVNDARESGNRCGYALLQISCRRPD